MLFSDARHRDLLDVVDRMRARIHASTTLEAAAQEVITAVCDAFTENVVLARLFITLPFSQLPEPLRRTAWNVVEAQSLQATMSETTPVLSLLATGGKDPAWRSRHTSRGHAAIPLCSQVFVDSIPMVARMLQEMGVDLGLALAGEPWLGGSGWTGLFHVEDARSARDDQGRRIIPAVDFVEAHHVRTVFGLGKAYANGSIASLVVFANSPIARERVEALGSLINGFKAGTMHHVANGRIFAPEP